MPYKCLPLDQQWNHRLRRSPANLPGGKGCTCPNIDLFAMHLQKPNGFTPQRPSVGLYCLQLPGCLKQAGAMLHSTAPPVLSLRTLRMDRQGDPQPAYSAVAFRESSFIKFPALSRVRERRCKQECNLPYLQHSPPTLNHDHRRQSTSGSALSHLPHLQ